MNSALDKSPLPSLSRFLKMLISCTESGLASFSCLWQQLGLGSGYQRRRHEYLDRRELVLGRELPV